MFLSPDKCSFVLFGLKDELQTDHVSNNVTIKNRKKKKYSRLTTNLTSPCILLALSTRKK